MKNYSVSTLQFAVDQVYSQISISKDTCKVCMEEKYLWQELSCCILSSQVNYDLALSAARAISKSGLLSSRRRPWEVVAEEIHSILNGKFQAGGRLCRYRFPIAKSSQIARTWSTILENSNTLIELLSEFDDVTALREWMVNHAPGLGPKQASMFLRNAGKTLDLAILDRHVLRYMEIAELIHANQRFPSTLQSYDATENILRHHANELGYRLGLLDWAIWIVMRVAKSKQIAQKVPA